jgi:hypothetical protein
MAGPDAVNDELEHLTDVPPIDDQAIAAAPRLLTLATTSVVGSGPVELDGFRFVSEREPGPWICCAPCAAAMVAGWAGAAAPTLATAHVIRTAAGYPHAGGCDPTRIRRALESRFGIGTVTARRERAAVDQLLGDGYAIAVPLDYGLLPDELRRWSPQFTGGHMATLAGRHTTGAWGWHDPLAPDGFGGEWAAPSSIIRAMWSSGAFAAGRQQSMAIYVNTTLRTGHTIRLPAGTPLYNDPGATDRRLTLSAELVADYLGAQADAYAVVVDTPAGYSDGKVRKTQVWVPRAQVANPTPRPDDDPGPSQPELEAAKLEGRLEEWDRWAGGLGIPRRAQ